MPSPFPGMDPWLEHRHVFPDIHDSLITFLREAVNECLPQPYVARSRTRVFVERKQSREPDVSVAVSKRTPKRERGGVALADAPAVRLSKMVPFHDPFEYGEHEDRYLDIFTSRDERLVTSVEILSPINKRAGSEGHRQYLLKQKKTLKAGVSLVEIDLLRGGTHTTAIPLDELRALAVAYDYHVCVSGAVVSPNRYIATARIRDRLPVIELPLDPGVEPVAVELQPLLDRAYDSGNYDRSELYDKPPVPPLTDTQQAWADAILKKARRARS